MKRKFKRKVLLMGMAVAASLPVGAFAKGNGKAERDAHHAGWRSAVSVSADGILEPPGMRPGSETGESGALFGKLKALVSGLPYRADDVSTPGWQLELLQSEPTRFQMTDDPRVAADKHVGLALRLKF